MAATKTIDQIFATCMSLYPLTAQEKEPRQIELLRNVWHTVLSDVPDELLNAVALDYFKHAHEWRPTPGHLFEAAMKASERNTNALAEQAWINAKEAIYFRESIADPIAVKTVAALGGGEVFAGVETDKIHFLHDRFVKMYESLKSSEQARGGLMLDSGTSNPRIASAAKRLTEWTR